MYGPTSGAISIGAHELQWMNVHHLRNHVAVVSQTPNLFDGTIQDNIAYGHLSEIMNDDIERAAQAAHVHDFIMSLPRATRRSWARTLRSFQGVKRNVYGSLALSRVLRRSSSWTETIRNAKVGRTTVMVTHKVEVMQMCNRVVVIEDGKVAEEGRYYELVERKGLFAKLASGGEWLSE